MPAKREPHAPEKLAKSSKSKSKPALSRNLFPDGEYTLDSLDVESVKRARELRSVDFVRFKKFHNFLTSFDQGVAKELEDNCNPSKLTAAISAWVNGIFGKEVTSIIEEQRESKEELLVLLIVAAALTKYGEQTLVGKDNLGELDDLVSTRFRTYDLRSSKQQEYRETHKSAHSHEKHVAHTVGLGFVHQLDLGLPPGKRVGDANLSEILNHNSNLRLVLAKTNLGLHKQVDTVLQSPDTLEGGYKWTKLQRDRLKQIVKQVQSDKFQEAMVDVKGDHLYDAIRSRLKQADASMWDDEKDLTELRKVNIRSRARYAAKNKVKKDAELRKKQQIDETGLSIESKPRTRRTKSAGTNVPATAPASASSSAKQCKMDKIEVTSATSIPVSAGGGQTIHTGPRGGKYYLKNGKKVYIK